MNTKENGFLQVKQLLDEEVKTGYIKYYQATCEPFVVKDIKELKELAKYGAEFYILLKGGIKSSKRIVWDEGIKKFYIANYIDDSDITLSEKQLSDKNYTNIGEALKKHSLIFES